MRWAAALVWLALFVLPAHANIRRSESWAQTRFLSAGRMREALNGRPAKDRGRREYEKVIAAYRDVYYGAPTSTKADPSAVAVAELMVEMGRRLADNNLLRSAIRQYQFLRREYPGSKYRFDALFTIGEIYKDDLGDAARAR
jgi:N-acetylmuramoyl-L-alanine amidase